MKRAWLAGLLGLTVLVLGVVWLLRQPGPEVPSLVADPVGGSCADTLAVRIGYEEYAGAVLSSESGWRLMGKSWLVGRVCRAGTLLIEVEGELAGSEPPRLNVTRGVDLLLDEPVSARRLVRVDLPGSGDFTMGYLNDYYKSEARFAFFNEFRLLNAGCRTLDVVVPPTAIGGYVPDLNYVNMAGRGPVVVTPCAAGRFSVLVSGSPVRGVYPKLSFEQNNRVVHEVVVGRKRQLVEFPVAPAPLKIYLGNPFAVELADRNLVVHSVKFIPRE